MADRSVSISLRARVTDFVAGMGQAKKSTQDLSRQMQQTGAYATEFRRRLEAATRALPKIEIDADSSPAEIKFAQLRAEMEKLADKKIGIDIDAGAAQAQLQEIQRELEKLERAEASIDVKADIGSALAELRAVDAEVSRLNGSDARVSVDADVGGALAGIAMVGAALASLPAVTTIAVGVTALGSAFAAAGIGAAGFAAVAVPSMGRINDALTAQASAAKSAGAATGGAGQSAAQAAQQAMQLEQAEKRLKDAQLERKQAQEDLTRAVEAGRRALEDMNFSLERSVLSQKDAALAVREAEARLAEMLAKGDASELDIERAMLSVEMAHQRSREQEVKTQRAKLDTAEANKSGVKGTQEYQKGLDKLAAAEAKVTEATAALKQMQLQQQAAMSGGGGAANKLTDAFAGLSKQEKALAKDLKAFKDEYVDWQRSLQGDAFPVIAQGLDLMRLGLRETTPLVKTASASFLTLGKDAEKALRGPFWQEFLYDVNTAMPTAITGLGRSFGNVVTGIAGVLDAFLPFVPTIVGGAEKATKAFSEWGQSLEDNPKFHEFIEFVKREAPQVWELIKNVAKALGNIGQAIAPLGSGAMAGLNLLAQIVSGMDPGHIQGIALAIGAIKLATMGMSAMGAWQNLAGGVTLAGDAAGKGKGAMAAFGKATIAAAGAVIAFEATGSVMSALGGQSQGLDKLTLALTELGQTGKWAGDLGDQWGGVFDDASKSAEGFREGLRELQDPSFGEMFWLHPLSELAALLPGLDSSVDRLEQKFTDTDAALAGMVKSGNIDGAARAFQELAKQAEAQGIPVEKLNQLLPIYGQAVRVAGNASATAGTQVKELQQSVDTFSGRTDAVQALRNLKTAFNDAEKAIKASSGALEINAFMTDKQKDAVLRAREAFMGAIEATRTAAEGQKAFGKNAFDATETILRQLPQLGELAGKNREAKDQVLALAAAYGVSAGDALKAMEGGKKLRDVIAELKSKTLHIDADTSKADAAIGKIIQTLSKRYVLGVDVRTDQQEHGRARGGIDRYAAGGIERYAAGGMRPRPPQIANKPTVLFGEGSSGRGATEAFIPYESRYRGRAISLLGQVASDFGLGQASQSLGTVPNRSRVSRPQQMPSHMMAAAQGAGSGSASSSSSSAAGKSGALVNVESLQVREHADIDRIGAALYSRLGSKGP